MENLRVEIESIILQFFRGKDMEELRQIHCGRDVDEHLDEETLYEIKHRLWYLLQTQHIRWHALSEKIKDMVENDESNDEEDDVRTDEDDD